MVQDLTAEGHVGVNDPESFHETLTEVFVGLSAVFT